MSSDSLDRAFVKLQELAKELDALVKSASNSYRTPTRVRNMELLKYTELEGKKPDLFVTMAKIELLFDLFREMIPPNELADRQTGYNDLKVFILDALRQLESKKLSDLMALVKREEKPMDMTLVDKLVETRIQGLKPILQKIRDAQAVQALDIGLLKQGSQLSKVRSNRRPKTSIARRSGPLSPNAVSRVIRSPRKSRKK